METVKHYLLDYPHYRNEWHILQRKLCRNAGSLSFLLSSPVAVMPLLKFIHATGCFKTHFGKDKVDKINTNSCRNGELRIAADNLESSIRKVVSDKRTQALVQLRRQLPPPLLDLSHSTSSPLLHAPTIPTTCSCLLPHYHLFPSLPAPSINPRPQPHLPPTSFSTPFLPSSLSFQRLHFFRMCTLFPSPPPSLLWVL